MLLPALLVLAAAPVSFQTGILTPPLIGSPDQAAVRFATSRAQELGLDPRTTLTPTGNFSTRFGGTIHLTQTINGLPITSRKVIVTFDTAQRVVRFSSTLTELGAFKLTPSLTAMDALAVASAEIPGAWLQKDGTPYGGAKKQLFVVNGEVHVGFLTFIPTLKNSESWHVAVDATDGSVLWVRNRAWANDNAAVYASSPGGVGQGIGVTPTVTEQLINLVPDAGRLTGTRLRALNCCPTVNCDPDAGPARATGMTQTFQGPVEFDVAICDQRQLASNDPSVHPSGDWVYLPVDPPRTATVSLGNLADWDAFSEVHGYFHATKAYEAMRALSVGPLARDGGFSPFTMRDTGAGGGLPTVWVNVSDADFNNAMPNSAGVYVADTLARTDNAMFLARENMEFLLLPPQVINSDALVMYQGQAADFAYDGPVLWHEFGHGLIHSTADWDTVVTFDQRSANNESSALHEGVSDLIAAMTGKRSIVGEYVGPRIDPTSLAIRNVDNMEKCPDVLWGESHQDSLHFTGAVWSARKQFLGTDDGNTFDAAFYAALVSFPPDVNFASAASIITQAITLAFPGDPDSTMKMNAAFAARGVTGCSKVLDVTNSLSTPRIFFGIPGTAFAGVGDNLSVPGPYQVKIRLPRGAKSVGMSGQMQSFGTMSRLELLAAVDRPITFAKNGTSLANDAMARTVPAIAQGVLDATLPINVPCGGEVYLAVANQSRRDRQIYDLQFAFDPADSCPEVDAGVPDAGMMMEAPIRLVNAPETLGDRVMGCSCNVTSPFAVIAAALWFLRRRRVGAV